MNKVHITTLGCPKNAVDSDKLAAAMAENGFVFVQDEDSADFLLINTCGFITSAKEESINEILRLAALKKGQGKLVVLGCLAQRYRDELMKEMPEIDAIMGVSDEAAVIEYCRSVAGKEALRKKAYDRPFMLDTDTAGYPYSYLKISDGCDRKCTFCAIPSIRGRFRSIEPDDIIRDAVSHIENGKKELVLVAQDITSYGKGRADLNLPKLLKQLAAIDADFRIRLLYLYPTNIDDELLDLIASEEKIYNYFDIPLQHSEDRLLRLMGRRGSRQEYTKLIRRIRRMIPGAVLRTTFIVGFPSETEHDFNALADFVEETRFDRLGVFKFSREEGTPSYSMTGQVPEQTKERRLAELMQRQALISLEKNRELTGQRYEAIVDEVSGDAVVARLYSHAPEIDGVVLIDRDPASAMLKAGDFVDVEITEGLEYDLRAVISNNRRLG
ncbi:MAG: 30S ribosomal protein S12 methylthiotransferase RimO [Nitrospiraceae bacterium]|nr:30S ribosomal protein S12 methylthiotransferase RimO [Nitrospiraceae bacterium]